MLIKVVRDGEPNSFDASHALSKNNRKFAKLVGLLNDIRANHRLDNFSMMAVQVSCQCALNHKHDTPTG